MSFQVALFAKTPEGAIQLLGRTDEPVLVDAVRDHILKCRRDSVRKLEHRELTDDDTSDEPRTAA